MKHLSLKKLLIQFFIVGAYMGYHISNGFGYGIFHSGEKISITNDEISQEQNQATQVPKEEIKLLIKFKNNTKPYLDVFSKQE